MLFQTQKKYTIFMRLRKRQSIKLLTGKAKIAGQSSKK